MICSRCNLEKKTVLSFGKPICQDCILSRPLKGRGNSGLSNKKEFNLPFVFSCGLNLKLVPKSDDLFGKLFHEHYPGSRGIVGRSINYLIENNGRVVGIIGGASPPKNYTVFRDYFNGIDEVSFFNNNVFRLTDHEKNLGTKVLKLFRNKIFIDYEKKYKSSLIGLVTFVEKPRTGAIYKADNWDFLGETKGVRMFRRGENWEKQFVKGEKKLIYGYKYKKIKNSRKRD
jgi:hypothetical protein